MFWHESGMGGVYVCGVKVGWTGEDVFDEWGRGTLGFVL